MGMILMVKKQVNGFLKEKITLCQDMQRIIRLRKAILSREERKGFGLNTTKMEGPLGLKDIILITGPQDFTFVIIKMPKNLKKQISSRTNTREFTTGITVMASWHIPEIIITRVKNRV